MCFSLLILLLDILLHCSGSITTRYSKLQYGYRLNKRMIDSFTVYSIMDCMEECLRRKRCKSINYYQGAHYCEINYESRTKLSSVYVQDSGWIYSEIYDWDRNIFEPCLNANCRENEKCNQLASQNVKCILSDYGVPRSFDVAERWDGIAIYRGIHLKCAKSFNQTGSQIFLCQTNGKWKTDLPCKTDCPTGWFAFDNNCYFYGEERLPWYEAKEICENKNAYLVEVNGEKENSFLAKFILQAVGSGLCTGNYPCPVWSGGNDLDMEGAFTWIPRKHTLVYTNWYPGQPNDGKKGQDCVRITSNGYWDDANCYSKLPYICEKE